MIRVLAFVVAMLCIGPAIAQPLPADLDRANAVVIDSTKGRIVIKLRTDLAPRHADRIKQLARDGFYNNVPFHRVMDGFMAQTGDGERFNGTGGSKYPNLKPEFSKVPFRRGIVAMARASAEDSANSQFFIMFADAAFLNERIHRDRRGRDRNGRRRQAEEGVVRIGRWPGDRPGQDGEGASRIRHRSDQSSRKRRSLPRHRSPRRPRCPATRGVCPPGVAWRL